MLHRIVLLLAVLPLVVTACVESPNVDSLYEATMAIHFRVCTSDDEPSTKAMGDLLNGSDVEISKLYMYCFDQNGRYLGRFLATNLTSSTNEGTFKGLVPPATARIHFVANADIPVGNDKLGLTEEQIFHGESASFWNLTNCLRNTVGYWGYLKKATPQVIQEVFNSTQSEVIYLLRDRAKIVPGTFLPQSHLNANTIQWTLYNDMSDGFIAPYNETLHTFEGYFTSSSMLEPASVITPHKNSNRNCIVGENIEEVNNALNQWAANESHWKMFPSDGTGVNTPSTHLFAFEDYNIIEDNDISNSIRVIIRVKTSSSNQTLYYPVRLTNSDGTEQVQLKRGHVYKLNLGYLPVGLGYSTFAEAARATTFTNGQLVAIPVVVPEVSDGRFSLKITYKLGEDEIPSTSILYQTKPANGVVNIPFEFKRVDNESLSTDDYSFQANWISTSHDVASETITVIPGSPSGSTLNGNVQITLNDIGSTLKTGTIRLQEKNHHLERNIYIYSIQEFSIKDSQLTKMTETDGERSMYRLSFQLPNGSGFSEYPEGLYPIKVKIASKWLRPKAVHNGGQAPISDVVFGIEVKTTKPGVVPGITKWGTWGETIKDWFFQGSQADPELWNFWYVYTIAAKDTSPEYWFDLTDITSDYAAENRPDNVGLYLKIEFFGDAKEIAATN